MKIKRWRLEQLEERSKKLGELEHIWIVQRVKLLDGTTPEVLRMPLIDYVNINKIDENQPFSVAPQWLIGPSHIEFITVYSGFERFLIGKYGAMMSSPQTTELNND